jgi:hypothetical protein
VVDGGGLENHCTGNGTGGSNPSLSATFNLEGLCFFNESAILFAIAAKETSPRTRTAASLSTQLMPQPWLIDHDAF